MEENYWIEFPQLMSLSLTFSATKVCLIKFKKIIPYNIIACLGIVNQYET